eukprot:958975-Pyramimonas_sp.AAC.1
MAIRSSLDAADGIAKLLSHLSILNGERPGDRERGAQNLALFDHMVRRGETLTDFVLRRDAQTAEAEVHGLTLPDPIKA